MNKGKEEGKRIEKKESLKKNEKEKGDDILIKKPSFFIKYKTNTDSKSLLDEAKIVIDKNNLWKIKNLFIKSGLYSSE